MISLSRLLIGSLPLTMLILTACQPDNLTPATPVAQRPLTQTIIQLGGLPQEPSVLGNLMLTGVAYPILARDSTVFQYDTQQKYLVQTDLVQTSQSYGKAYESVGSTKYSYANGRLTIVPCCKPYPQNHSDEEVFPLDETGLRVMALTQVVGVQEFTLLDTLRQYSDEGILTGKMYTTVAHTIPPAYPMRWTPNLRLAVRNGDVISQTYSDAWSGQLLRNTVYTYDYRGVAPRAMRPYLGEGSQHALLAATTTSYGYDGAIQAQYTLTYRNEYDSLKRLIRQIELDGNRPRLVTTYVY